MSSRELQEGLQAAESFLRRFCVFPSDHCYTAAALWVAHVHLWTDEWPDLTPYLIFDSPQKRCGKSRALDAIEPMVPAPWRIDAAPTASVLFRKLDRGLFTILIDEVDQLFTRGADRGELVAVLNAGWRRGATIAKTNKKTHEAEDHSAFAPKVLAGIDSSRWSSTIVDRAVRIELRRRRKSERVERWRHRLHYAEGEQVAEQLAALAELGETVSRVQVADIDEIDDRAFDSWEALLQVAELAGASWPGRARAATIALSSGRVEEDDLGVLLLADVREVLADRQRISTADLLDALLGLTESPWREYGREGLTANRMARLLRPFGVRSRSIRIDDWSGKGYDREDLLDAFERYLPLCSLPKRHNVTTATDRADKANNGGDVTVWRFGKEQGLPELQEAVEETISIEKEASS